jgi:hypothetical protein
MSGACGTDIVELTVRNGIATGTVADVASVDDLEEGLENVVSVVETGDAANRPAGG